MTKRSIVVPAICLLGVFLAPLRITAQEQPRRALTTSLSAAFRDVIRDARSSTVQVYGDGYRVALGIIVRPDGYIATKASELKGRLECQLTSETQKREAKVVARDSATDLAILKVDGRNLPVAQWNTDQPPAVGSWLATPGVLQELLSVGVVSVAARKILPPQAALGIQLDTSDNIARIASVARGLAAAKAGLKDGDIVRKVDEEEIKGRTHLQQTIRAHQPGDNVAITIERDGKLQTIPVVLGNMTDLVHDERSEFQNTLGGPLSERRSGFPLAIQHDSVLKPADCGGPIVDIDGKVVGMNIARAGRVESFALPASLVRETVEKLLAADVMSVSTGAPPAPSAPPPHER